MLLALFALTLQHKPKFYGHRRRHLWKLWHSNICIMTIMTVRYRIFLDCRHFPRPLSQLLDFLPQGYPEVSPSESIQIRMLFIVCKYKYRKYRKPRHQIKRTHFPWNLSMLLARFALTLQHKPKFHGNGRRHLWKLWRSNNCIMTIMTVRYRIFLDWRHFLRGLSHGCWTSCPRAIRRWVLPNAFACCDLRQL